MLKSPILGTVFLRVRAAAFSRQPNGAGSPKKIMSYPMNKRNFKHGYRGTPTYNSWKKMKDRCLNPHADNYPDYGGRGIKICKRWMKFENFLADMGERPIDPVLHRTNGRLRKTNYNYLTLDRINNNGPYRKRNCRWSSYSNQQGNKRAASLRRWAEHSQADHHR
jgi:hypothetical protein